MCHALIIDDNMIVSRAIEDRLVSLGFNSFDRTWTEEQAVEAARQRAPSLVVVGDTIAKGSPTNAARRISSEREVPILMITADRYRAQRSIQEDNSRSGPFYLSEIAAAVDLARAPNPNRPA